MKISARGLEGYKNEQCFQGIRLARKPRIKYTKYTPLAKQNLSGPKYNLATSFLYMGPTNINTGYNDTNIFKSISELFTKLLKKASKINLKKFG